jgi:hypothetical protein
LGWGQFELLSNSLKKRPIDLQPLTTIQQNNFSPPTAPCLRPNNVNGMRNPAPINHFPPTLFSPNRSPYMKRRIYFRRNVFGSERAGAFVNLFGLGNVTFEADDRELGFSQAGINGADADAGAIELEAPGIEQ